MSKLDLTNKVSPCCGKRIKEFTIDHLYQGKVDCYSCSYCEGELTKTEILRFNLKNNVQLVETTQDKFSALEERLEKLEAKFKVDEYSERSKIRIFIFEELEKFDNKKITFTDRNRITNEIMDKVYDLIKRIKND
jgi:hypothetical protein